MSNEEEKIKETKNNNPGLDEFWNDIQGNDNELNKKAIKKSL